jgi:hypothetical protein
MLPNTTYVNATLTRPIQQPKDKNSVKINAWTPCLQMGSHYKTLVPLPLRRGPAFTLMTGVSGFPRI